MTIFKLVWILFPFINFCSDIIHRACSGTPSKSVHTTVGGYILKENAHLRSSTATSPEKFIYHWKPLYLCMRWRENRQVSLSVYALSIVNEQNLLCAPLSDFEIFFRIELVMHHFCWLYWFHAFNILIHCTFFVLDRCRFGFLIRCFFLR